MKRKIATQKSTIFRESGLCQSVLFPENCENAAKSLFGSVRPGRIAANMLRTAE